MTYKKDIPAIVPERWATLNNDYTVEFSYDDDCIAFLRTNCNDAVANLFTTIEAGPHKADLWRLCKLYVNGGIYADVDLVPYLDIDSLDKDITFYSCKSIVDNTVFQAFMVQYKPKSPLIFHFLLSYILNRADTKSPTEDMYTCLKYNLGGIQLLPDTAYDIRQVKIPVHIGPSTTKQKSVNLYYFPSDIVYTIQCDSPFSFHIENNILTVTHTGGWTHDLTVDICIEANERVLLFKENRGEHRNWITSYVTHNGIKILDSRDLTYFRNNGW
jgi:mannosyltransferase OCH1-like enzyme